MQGRLDKQSSNELGDGSSNDKSQEEACMLVPLILFLMVHKRLYCQNEANHPKGNTQETTTTVTTTVTLLLLLVPRMESHAISHRMNTMQCDAQ